MTPDAGPAKKDEEEGLVHFAWRNGSMDHREEHFGSIGRGPVRIACLRTGLRMIAAAIESA